MKCPEHIECQVCQHSTSCVESLDGSVNLQTVVTSTSKK